MLLLLSLLAFLPLLTAEPASARLVEYDRPSGHVMYDTDTRQYWIWDIGMFTDQTYPELLKSISTLNAGRYFGIDTWHLAHWEDTDELLYGNVYAEVLEFNPTSTGYNRYDGQLWAGWSGRVELPQGRDTHLMVAFGERVWEQYPPEFYDPDYTKEPGWGGWSPPWNPADMEVYENLGAWIASEPGYDLPAPTPEPSTLLLLGSGAAGIFPFLGRTGLRRFSRRP